MGERRTAHIACLFPAHHDMWRRRSPERSQRLTLPTGGAILRSDDFAVSFTNKRRTVMALQVTIRRGGERTIPITPGCQTHVAGASRP